MKKNKSKQNIYKEEDMKRYLGILHEEQMALLKGIPERFDGIDKRFESIDKRFDGIDKRFDGIDKRFDGIDKKLAEHDKKFEGIDKKLAEHDTRFDKLDKRLDSHTEMIVKMAENIEILKGDMDIVKSGLQKKVEYNEFSAPQRRVRVLESKVK